MNNIKSNPTVELILFQLDTSSNTEFSVHNKYLVKIAYKKGEYQLDVLDLFFKDRLMRCSLENKAQLIYTITELLSSYRNIHCYNFSYKFSGSFSLTGKIFAFLLLVIFLWR